MLSCDLAKKLKDAGFPQTSVLTYNGIGAIVLNADLPDIHKDTCASIPALEEIIEKCGEGFLTLRRILKEEKKSDETKNQCNVGMPMPSPDILNHRWRVVGQDIYDHLYIYTASTPEEAAMLLWLDLKAQLDKQKTYDEYGELHDEYQYESGGTYDGGC